MIPTVNIFLVWSAFTFVTLYDMSENYPFLENLLSKKLKSNIKLLHIYSMNLLFKNVIIVTNDDRVYCYGYNLNGVLGLDKKFKINELTFNEDLSGKNLIDFKNGLDHAIGRTSDGKIYCWGRYPAVDGALNIELLKPQLNQHLKDKYVVDICCGADHTIVLTNEGEAYAWGQNCFGQIGIGSTLEYISIPTKIEGFNGEKVKAISCGFKHSLALTESGRVYSWGQWEFSWIRTFRPLFGFKNSNYISNEINSPKLVELNGISIERISCGYNYCLLLSSDGEVYYLKNKYVQNIVNGNAVNQLIPEKINFKNRIVDIVSHDFKLFCAAQAQSGEYYVWWPESRCSYTPVVVNFNSFNDIFNHYFGTTYKTIQLSKYFERPFTHNKVRNEL